MYKGANYEKDISDSCGGGRAVVVRVGEKGGGENDLRLPNHKRADRIAARHN